MKTKEKEKHEKKLTKEIDRLKNSTELLLTDATMIQVGNNDDACWNGEEACEALKKILTQIEKNKTLLDQLEKCAKLLKN